MYESDAYTVSLVKTVTVSEIIKWKSVYCCSVFSDPTSPSPPKIPTRPILTPTQTHHILTQTYPDIDTDTPLTVTDTLHQAPVVQELYSANHCMPLHVNHYPGVNPLIYVPRETIINFLLTIHSEKKRLGELIK